MQSLNLADASELVSLEDFFHTHIWAGCSTLSFLLIRARNVQRSRRSLPVCFKIKHFLNWSQDEDRCPINSHHYWRTSRNRQLNPVWAQCCQGCTHPKSWSQHLLGHLVCSQLEKSINTNSRCSTYLEVPWWKGLQSLSMRPASFQESLSVSCGISEQGHFQFT